MVRVDRLLQFIAQLQSESSALQRRRLLLRYIRKLLQAPLAALFLLDKKHQQLVLLIHSGKQAERETETSLDAASIHTQPLTLSRIIATGGLFGEALMSQKLMLLSDLAVDKHALPEEKAWGSVGARLLLASVRESSLPESAVGLLLVALPPATDASSHATEMIENEGDLQVCIALLSSYLTIHEEEGNMQTHEKISPQVDELDRAMSQLLRNRRGEQRGTLPELLYSMSSITDLYEIGLVICADSSMHDLYQHILSMMGQIVLAQSSCLLLYETAQQHFIPVAWQGNELSYEVLAQSLDSREMERLALRGPGETIAPILLGEQRVLLVTLTCNCLLLGVVALAINESDSLLDERSLLLSYMGNVAALILKNRELRIYEVQENIEQEQQRIAQDIHDGPVQNIGYILHRFELLQHLGDTQAITLQGMLEELHKVERVLKETLQALRHDIASLLPLELEEQEFTTALESLINEYRWSEPQLGITYVAEIPAIQAPLLQGVLFRFIQESLNNIRKHAQAKHVNIHLRVVQNALQAEIRDDGVGFEQEATNLVAAQMRRRSGEHLGLQSMEERIKRAGGTLELVSQAGHGTLLRARLPLSQPVVVLTNREREILRLVAQGLSNAHIARRLAISRETVKSHIHHIMQKLQVHDRTQAAVVATRQGWL